MQWAAAVRDSRALGYIEPHTARYLYRDRAVTRMYFIAVLCSAVESLDCTENTLLSPGSTVTRMHFNGHQQYAVTARYGINIVKKFCFETLLSY